MNILWLKSDLLVPLDKGGKLRTWHLMRSLARRHKITYLSFAEPDQMADQRRPSAQVVEAMRAVTGRLEVIRRRDPPKRSPRFYLDAARHLLSPLPYAVGKYRSPAFERRLGALLAESAPDLIVCDFLFPAVNLPSRLPCPAVLFTHNVEAEIWRRHAETNNSRIGRWLYRMQHWRMRRFEERTLRRFDMVLAVSDADQGTIERLYPGAVRRPIHVVKTGVDTKFFAPTPSQDGSRQLVFTGSMDWLPNEDAMVFFCREVLPLIRAEEPEVSLSIVGRAPTPAVKNLAGENGITVTGRVDDVRPHMHQAAVYVVPIRIGGGTRLKIFEAMSMGRAVVSTTVGAEGLPVRDQEHLLIADDPPAFARAVVRLLQDVAYRRTLSAAARRLVVEHFDWSAVAGDLEEALVQCRLEAVPQSAEAGARVMVPGVR